MGRMTVLAACAAMVPASACDQGPTEYEIAKLRYDEALRDRAGSEEICRLGREVNVACQIDGPGPDVCEMEAQSMRLNCLHFQAEEIGL